MENCVFCKIINNEIPSRKIYEDDTLIVFMDVEPSADGHMLIVSKKHVTDFLELDNETATHINEIIKVLKEKVYKALNPDGIRFVNNYGCYQAVKHYHLHLIPCYLNDNGLSDIDEVYDKIKNA